MFLILYVYKLQSTNTHSIGNIHRDFNFSLRGTYVSKTRNWNAALSEVNLYLQRFTAFGCLALKTTIQLAFFSN